MNVFRKSVRIFSYVVLGLGFVTGILCCFNSDKLEISKYNYKNEKMKSGDTFKCAVISDYHHRDLSFSNTNMIDAINGLDDDTNAIFFTGDLIDSHVKNLDNVNKILEAANNKKQAKKYFVTGNHEEYAPLWPQLRDSFNSYNVKYLDNMMETITLTNETKINIFGLMDPRFDLHTYKNGRIEYGNSKKYLDAFKPLIETNNINILLAHRPELVDLYKEYGFDYILCGHTHGGQVRIGNWTPLNIAFKGKTYPRGEYKINDKTTMVVSSGLGHTAMFPIRINCNPEIVTVTIKK